MLIERMIFINNLNIKHQLIAISNNDLVEAYKNEEYFSVFLDGVMIHSAFVTKFFDNVLAKRFG